MRAILAENGGNSVKTCISENGSHSVRALLLETGLISHAEHLFVNLESFSESIYFQRRGSFSERAFSKWGSLRESEMREIKRGHSVTGGLKVGVYFVPGFCRTSQSPIFRKCTPPDQWRSQHFLPGGQCPLAPLWELPPRKLIGFDTFVCCL